MQDITARQVARVAACEGVSYTDYGGRLRRERKVDDSEADEDYPLEGVLPVREIGVQGRYSQQYSIINAHHYGTVSHPVRRPAPRKY